MSSECFSLLNREHHMQYKGIKLDSERFSSCETMKMFLLLFTPRMIIQVNQRKKKIFQNLHKVQVVLNLHAYFTFILHDIIFNIIEYLLLYFFVVLSVILFRGTSAT